MTQNPGNLPRLCSNTLHRSRQQAGYKGRLEPGGYAHRSVVGPDVKLLPCVATDKNMVKKVFLDLLYSVLAVIDAGKP